MSAAARQATCTRTKWPGAAFLKKVLSAEPFMRSFERYSEIQTAFANRGRKLSEEKRREMLDDSFEIFTDKNIEQLRRECQSYI